MEDEPQGGIYLDYNATTPVGEEVLEEMGPYFRDEFGNPSSTHRTGRAARRAVDRARRQVAELIGASPSEIIFTSGGTESNNMAIHGVCRRAESPGRVVTSAIEHPSVRMPCERLVDSGWKLTQVGVGAQGRIDTDEALEAIDDQTALVTVMHSNNETGTIQPLEPVVEAARRVGAVVHTDAAQSVGKVELDVDELGVDLLSIAGHKIYAPKGIGALYIRDGVELSPLQWGASHERGLRPGTENVPAVAGLGAACEAIARRGHKQRERILELRKLLERKLRDGVDELEVNGHSHHRLPNTLNVRFPGVEATELLAHTPQIAASTGSACKSGCARPSRVLTAMGLDARQAGQCIRLSLGCCNDRADVERAAELLVDAYQKVAPGQNPQPSGTVR